MKFLLLAAALLAAAPSRGALVAADPPPAADWRQDRLPDGMKDALRGAGYRLEDDGRVLDPRTRAPLTPGQLAAALSDITLSSQRLALERLRLLLAKEPLSDADRASAAALKGSLPPDVAQALEAGAGAADLRRLSERDLSRISAYYDGARTLDERRAAAAPVLAGAPGPRVPLPYFDPSERALGDALRAAASGAIGGDPFGRTVLARLNGKDGKPDLPPIVIEDLAADVAEYDYRRRALVVDRQTLLASVTADAAPAARAALEKSLGSRRALIDYLNAHPEAVASYAAKNDALLVHELTHAWQDRREPLMQEMARGNLPQAMLLDYEIEGWLVKNLYIHSRLKRDPAAAIDPVELDDYRQMTAGYGAWEQALTLRYQDAISNAMDIGTVDAILLQRVEAARRRAVATRDEQTAKALDLAALTRAQKELRAANAAEAVRLRRLSRGDASAAAKESPALLAEHYLAAALDAPTDIDAAIDLQKADAYAQKTGDAALIAKVRACKGRRR